MYQAILAHKHALEAESDGQLSMREVIADAIRRWIEEAGRPLASERDSDPTYARPPVPPRPSRASRDWQYAAQRLHRQRFRSVAAAPAAGSYVQPDRSLSRFKRR